MSIAGPSDLKPLQLTKKRESVISTAATMRVLNVLRHWVSKHSQVSYIKHALLLQEYMDSPVIHVINHCLILR